MADWDEMESRLRRELIPRGMSDEGLASLDAMIDEWAVEPEPSRPRWWVAAGLVVAGGLGWGAIHAAMGDGDSSLAQKVEQRDAMAAGDEAQEVRLLSEAEGIVAADANGEMVFDEDGQLLEAWRVQVLHEERYHDEKTGHEVRVFSPRDELVLMPVHTF